VIAGQVYESDCWVNYKRYYYDAWWTPVRYSDGSIVSWDTAGMESGNDIIYDFTQLNNGNLVFVGKKKSFSSDIGGIWTFVTDSAGEHIFWEQQTKIIYKTDDGRALLPLSVCATPDSGFTVVGQDVCVDTTGGINAFAVHFRPAEPVVISKKPASSTLMKDLRTNITSPKVIFRAFGIGNSKLTIYYIAGKKIASLRSSTLSTGNTSFVLDRSRISNGVYSYSLSSNSGLITGRFVLK